jgi:hypothetical protein
MKVAHRQNSLKKYEKMVFPVNPHLYNINPFSLNLLNRFKEIKWTFKSHDVDVSKEIILWTLLSESSVQKN